jgi:hypothetical protein
MKFVCDLLSLRSTFAGCSGIRSSAVAAHHFNFRVGKQPGFDGLLLAVWKNLDRATQLKIDQQGPVDLALFPRPVINAQNAN